MVEFRVSLGLIVLTSVTAVPIETRLTYIRKIKQGQTVHKTSLQIENRRSAKEEGGGGEKYFYVFFFYVESKFKKNIFLS